MNAFAPTPGQLHMRPRSLKVSYSIAQSFITPIPSANESGTGCTLRDTHDGLASLHGRHMREKLALGPLTQDTVGNAIAETLDGI